MYPCTELHVKSVNEEKFVHDQFGHQICSSDKYVGGFLSVYAKIDIYCCNSCYLARIAFFHIFHFRSSYMISYIIHTHFFHGNIWTHNWPAPNVSGFIAQLVEHRTGIARSRVQTPLKYWIFFQASLRNCKNCVNCDDHFFVFIKSFCLHTSLWCC